MRKQTALLAQAALIAATFAYSFFMSSKLPAIVPTHWNINGKPDAYGSASTNLWLMPGVLVCIVLLTLVLPAISPKRYEVTRFSKTYYYTMFLVTLLMVAMHVVILNASTGGKYDIGRALFSVLFAFFALMGNVLGKVKQNFYVGVRTPWTIADSRVWDHTHREAGHLWVLGGAVGLLLSLVGVPMAGLIAVLFVLAFIPVIRSYVWYQRLVVKTDAQSQG